MYAEAPYKLRDISCDNDSVEFVFRNMDCRNICRVVFVFSVYNEDGEPCCSSDGYVTAEYAGRIGAYEERRIALCFDDSGGSCTDCLPETDFIFARLIEYEDGGIWKDWYGLYAL